MKEKNFPQTKFQEEVTAEELNKTDISNITEQEFRIIVIRLITGLEKKHRRQQRIYCCRDQRTKI